MKIKTYSTNHKRIFSSSHVNNYLYSDTAGELCENCDVMSKLVSILFCVGKIDFNVIDSSFENIRSTTSPQQITLRPPPNRLSPANSDRASYFISLSLSRIVRDSLVKRPLSPVCGKNNGKRECEYKTYTHTKTHGLISHTDTWTSTNNEKERKRVGTRGRQSGRGRNSSPRSACGLHGQRFSRRRENIYFV